MPRRRFRPAPAFTILPSLRQASPSSFPQNLSFELREYGKQTGHVRPAGVVRSRASVRETMPTPR
jgi:hypothetical protein